MKMPTFIIQNGCIVIQSIRPNNLYTLHALKSLVEALFPTLIETSPKYGF